jgi:dihydroneopterin aldolase
VTDTIELRDIRFSAIVGVLPEERERQQPLSVDIDIVRDFTEAARHDDIDATTNYAHVITKAITIAQHGEFQLLETLAHRIASGVLGVDVAIKSVTVTVRKLRPPVPEDVATVGVRCTLTR